MDLDVAVGEGDLAYADEAAERVGRALAERVGEDRSRDRGGATGGGAGGGGAEGAPAESRVRRIIVTVLLMLVLTWTCVKERSESGVQQR